MCQVGALPTDSADESHVYPVLHLDNLRLPTEFTQCLRYRVESLIQCVIATMAMIVVWSRTYVLDFNSSIEIHNPLEFT